MENVKSKTAELIELIKEAFGTVKGIARNEHP